MTARLVTVTATAPSAWAPYLVNGDDSGIDAEDKAAADRFTAWLGATPCSCDDAGFLWRHDAWQFMPFGADCQTYLALIEESSR